VRVLREIIDFTLGGRKDHTPILGEESGGMGTKDERITQHYWEKQLTELKTRVALIRKFKIVKDGLER